MKDLILAGLFSVFAASAFANEHDHGHGDHGDIVGEAEGGAIEVETGMPLAGGGRLFEADFGDFALGTYATNAPGFEVEDGPFGAFDFLAYNMQSDLKSWDGISWVTSSNSLFSIENDYESPTLQPFAKGMIGQADDDGGVHTHIDFFIDPNAAVGAYLIEFILEGYTDNALQSSNGYSSDSVFIAFNNGLSSEDYEFGIDAMSPVPVPAAAWLFVSGLAGLAGLRKARK